MLVVLFVLAAQLISTEGGYIVKDDVEPGWATRWYKRSGYAWSNLVKVSSGYRDTLDECKHMCRMFSECRAFNYGIKGTTIPGTCQMFAVPDMNLMFYKGLPTHLKKDEYWTAYYRAAGNEEPDEDMGDLCKDLGRCRRRAVEAAAAPQSGYLLLAAGGAGAVAAAAVVGWLKQRRAAKDTDAEVSI